MSLLDELARNEPGARPPAPSPAKRGVIAGIVAVLAMIVAKAKLFGLLVLKFGTTAWTMALAAWIYAGQVGWSFAALLVGLILVHEIGHGLAARLVGIRVGPPVFIPLFGAFIALRDRPRDPWENFVVACGGPLIGGLASIACLAAAELLGGDARRLLHGGGMFALLLNLFNLLPVWIFDGAKMLPVVRGADAIAGLIGFIVAMVISAVLAGGANGLAVIVALVVAFVVARAARTPRHPPASLLERLQPTTGPLSASADEVPLRRRRIAALCYFGMLAGYGALVQLIKLPA